MSSMTAETCARVTTDRRVRPTPMFSRYWLRGRRREGRRHGESMRIYVDGYSSTEWTLILTLLLFSAVDLVLTLVHVAQGGSEANPIMAWALESGGTAGFATAKILLTGAACLVLLLHARFPLARRSLQASVAIYVLVLAWHVLVALDRLGNYHN